MVNASYDASGSYLAIYDQAAFDASAGEEGSQLYNGADFGFIVVAAVSRRIFAQRPAVEGDWELIALRYINRSSS